MREKSLARFRGSYPRAGRFDSGSRNCRRVSGSALVAHDKELSMTSTYVARPPLGAVW